MNCKTKGKLKNLTYDILYQLHWVEGKSMNEIAKIYNATGSSVIEHSQKFGFIIRDSNLKKSKSNKAKLKDLTYDVFYKLYFIELIPINKISVIYDVKKRYIINLAKEFGINLKIQKRLQNVTHEELYQLYCVEEKSSSEIGLIYNCDKHVVCNKLKKLGIKIRDKKTAVKLAISGPKNHSWKGGTTTLNVKIRDLPEYYNWRKSCFIRDKKTCQICGRHDSKTKYNVDHIKPFSVILQKNNITSLESAISCQELWDIDNGRVLCVKCHRSTDSYGRVNTK